MNKNYSYFLNYLNKNKNTSKKKVLDFGCGEGKLLNTLIENGFDAYGVDTNHTKNNKKYISKNNEKLSPSPPKSSPKRLGIPKDHLELAELAGLAK